MEIQLEVIYTGFTHGILFIDLDILKIFWSLKNMKKKDQSLQQKKGSFDIFQVLDDLPF